MRALLIAAGLFFSIFGGGLIYFALSGTGHEYDLKLVLPIDTRKMPKPVALPEIVSQVRTMPAQSRGDRWTRGGWNAPSSPAVQCASPTARRGVRGSSQQ